ncbi:MAG: putative HAF family extracellular repeat protein [Planctomycetota bacterium]|jgi:probable HAF family extracellular repeat protein
MNLRTLLAVTLTSSAALAGGGYTYTDLGTLGGDGAGALSLNDQGQVVGWSTIPGCTTMNGQPCRRAFLWEKGVMTDLGLLAGDEESTARAINNNGLIAGTSQNNVNAGSGTYHAVSWNGAAGATALSDLGQGTSWANDVNDAGTIVGYSNDIANNKDSAVTWQAGVLSDVGATASQSNSRGRGINESGHLIGMGWELFQPNDSISFDGGWMQLGGFGQFENSEGFDLNDTGLAVGTQAFPNGSWHATTWDLSHGGSALDLGALPGHELSYLVSVNDSGAAVGHSIDEDNGVIFRGIYTDGTTLTDINDLLPAGTNAVVWEATGINEAGDIVGTAVVNGFFRAFLLEVDDGGGNYCTPLANSTGQAAVMSINGSVSLADDNLELVAEPLPNTPFLFFYGPSQVELPFGDGVRCAGGGITRVGPPAVASGNRAARVLDLGALGIQPGSQNFQCWFRDTAAGGAGFNTSDGYEVIFTP